MEYTTRWPWLQGEIRHAAEAFAERLAGLEADTPIRGHDWTVAEVGSHVAMMPTMMGLFADAATQPDPADFDDFRTKSLSLAETLTPDEMAHKLLADTSSWLDGLGNNGDREIQWWVPSTVQGVGGAALAELLLHRADLGRLTGERPKLTRKQATAIIEGTLPGASAFAKPDVAETCEGTYHLKVRGATDWTLTVADRQLLVEQGRPDDADVRLNVDPVSLVLTSYGRANAKVEALKGKQMAYGRKPWLAMRFDNLVDAP